MQTAAVGTEELEQGVLQKNRQTKRNEERGENVMAQGAGSGDRSLNERLYDKRQIA